MRYVRSGSHGSRLIVQDATLAVDLLCGMSNCTGRIAATGMCLGGHLVSYNLQCSRQNGPSS